jgi:hypothetical protein
MGRVFFNTRENVHTLDSGVSAYQCLASDSGKTFILQSASAMAITLPADADIEFGWHCKFIMNLDNNDAYLIKCSDTTNQMFDGGVNYQLLADATADVFQGYAAAAADDSQLALDTNLANNEAKQGSWVDIRYIETNRFMVTGHVVTADANGTGAAIFSDI